MGGLHKIFYTLVFTGSTLYAEDTNVVINEGKFDYSIIDHNREDLTITSVVFTDTQVEATMPGFTSYTEKVIIDSCIFTHEIQQAAIYLNSYPNYEITNSEFDCETTTSVYIYESGYGSTYLIEDNEIDGNNQGTAIYLYHGIADILGSNDFHENTYGIMGDNNSDIYILGDQSSPYQSISNNDQGIKVSHNSFPTRINYNDIKINDDYHITCSDHSGRPHDIEMNYWGSPNSPAGYLYPDSIYYDYLPVWNHRGNRYVNEAQLLYVTAKDNIESENYFEAQQNFFDVITYYPETEYAKASMKCLLNIEKHVNDDFEGLQTYFLMNTTIQNSPELSILANDLANYCNLYLREFEDAIGYYEEIIEDPSSITDSIFAVIDAGYTYLLMEDLGYRSDHIGTIPSLKPNSWMEFEKKRDLLLGIITEYPDPDEEQGIVIPELPTLNKNYPNPFNPTTTITFSIPEESSASLTVYNIKGQKVKTLISTELNSGFHETVWDGRDENGVNVSSGVYFYTLKTLDQQIYKKMILMK
ncbi:MAG: hypothetical protein APR54_07675 [Candidatus Cloacimonas sp. SDB]|nr:MAG: hypothetical protein APR54_07675 [Candidatus Cloacimonas sp. SDB]